MMGRNEVLKAVNDLVALEVNCSVCLMFDHAQTLFGGLRTLQNFLTEAFKEALSKGPRSSSITVCCREVIKQRRAESGTALDRLHRAFVSYDKELMMSALGEFKPRPEHLPSNQCRFLVVENKKCIQICNSLAEENPEIWTANEVVIIGERSQARDDATFNVKYSQLHCYIIYDEAGGSKVYQNLEIDGPWRLLKSAKPSVGRLDKRSPGLFNCLGQPVESSQGAAFGLNEFNFVSYGRCSGNTRVEARDHIDRLELREACIILSVDDEFGNPAYFYMKMSTFPYSSSRSDELPGAFNAFAGKQQRVSTIAGVIGEQFTEDVVIDGQNVIGSQQAGATANENNIYDSQFYIAASRAKGVLHIKNVDVLLAYISGNGAFMSQGWLSRRSEAKLHSQQCLSEVCKVGHNAKDVLGKLTFVALLTFLRVIDVNVAENDSQSLSVTSATVDRIVGVSLFGMLGYIVRYLQLYHGFADMTLLNIIELSTDDISSSVVGVWDNLPPNQQTSAKLFTLILDVAPGAIASYVVFHEGDDAFEILSTDVGEEEVGEMDYNGVTIEMTAGPDDELSGPDEDNGDSSSFASTQINAGKSSPLDEDRLGANHGVSNEKSGTNGATIVTPPRASTSSVLPPGAGTASVPPHLPTAPANVTVKLEPSSTGVTSTSGGSLGRSITDPINLMDLDEEEDGSSEDAGTVIAPIDLMASGSDDEEEDGSKGGVKLKRKLSYKAEEEADEDSDNDILHQAPFDSSVKKSGRS